MQLGGIDTDHNSQNHQVTGCLHEHTTAQKGGALASAASQVAQLKQQEQQQTTQLSLAGLMEKTLEKGRAILRGIWGTSGEKSESTENGKAELAQPALTKAERDIHAAEIAGTVGRKTLEHQTQVNPYFQPVEHTAVPDVTPVEKAADKDQGGGKPACRSSAGKILRLAGQKLSPDEAGAGEGGSAQAQQV